MQLTIHIALDTPLSLPINYNHILQSIIYHALSVMPDYSEFLHSGGYTRGQRQYKMFQFSQLEGEYRIKNRQITFYHYVSFEVRSPEPLLIRLLGESIWRNGVLFGDRLCSDIHLEFYDYTVEENELLIRMKSPLTVYSTDLDTNEKYYYNPEEEGFYDKVNDNFYRKYQAYYGISPTMPITMKLAAGRTPKKFVTKYQSSYVVGWYGTYQLAGKRKYLDFLYQTGLGSKNAQGFGMFEIL